MRVIEFEGHKYHVIEMGNRNIMLAYIEYVPKVEEVNYLRDKTGVGMRQCALALKECYGDINKAKEWIRGKYD